MVHRPRFVLPGSNAQSRASRRPLGFSPWLALAWLAAIACGGGSSGGTSEARSTCTQIADGLASGWSRCGRATYDEAFMIFNTTLRCDEVEVAGDPTMCLQNLDAQDCEAVNSGVTPSTCQRLLTVTE